jgi:cytochrome P450
MLAFLLSPRSPAPWQVGRHVYEQVLFQEVLRACDEVIVDRLGWRLLPGVIPGGDACRRPLTEAELEPAVTALQIALVEVWRERGARPDAVAGASGGEFAAAFAAGALSLEDAMAVACCVGEVFGSGLGRGGTIAVSMSRADAEAYLPAAPKTVFLAAHHSLGSVALSGDPEAIAAVSADLSRRNVRWRAVPTSMAVHCPIMDVHEAAFLERLHRLRPRTPKVPIYSAAAGGLLESAAFDARHWWRVFRAPAYFADAAARLLEHGFDAFVDFGLQPVLSGAVQDAAAAAGRPVRFLPSGTAPETPLSSAPDPAAFDPGEPEVRRDPYPHYHALRARAPVLFLPRAGYWAVLRHADATEVLKEPALFSSSILRSFDSALLGADPPAHTPVRRRVGEAFTPPTMAALEAHIRARTGQLLDGIAGRAAFDLVAAVATPLPVSVIAELLGMAGEDTDRLKRWTDAIVAGAGGRPDPDARARVGAAIREMERFLADHVARLQAEPDDSLLGDLVGGRAGGPPLPARDAASLARLLLIAGNETTTNLIGNAVLALLRNPAELARLRDDRALVPVAIEETLRFDAPVQTVERVTTRPVEIAGVRIPTQARIGVMIGAANRDPSVFPDPDTFSIARDPHGHIAFGAGPHHCVGSLLSRLEARVVLEGLLDRLPRLRALQPLDEVQLTRSPHLRGPRLLMLAGPAGG